MRSQVGSVRPLRIFCVEDNPLIVLHIEHLLEETGQVFAGFADSFAQVRLAVETAEIDGALVDIDLTDGRTGPEIALWLAERGIPSILVTGQEDLAAQHADVALDVIIKPVSAQCLAEKITLFRRG
jgi:DNA-binding LytR/AlgR family response regulator